MKLAFFNIGWGLHAQLNWALTVKSSIANQLVSDLGRDV